MKNQAWRIALGLMVMVAIEPPTWAQLATSGRVSQPVASAPSAEWTAWGGDAWSRKYSPLDRIDATNVDRLVIAWTWHSPENARAATDPALRPRVFETTPLAIGGVVYTSTTHSDVVALDGASGRELWSFDTGSWRDGRPSNVGWVHRGLATWSDGGGARRIFIATGNGRLWSIDTGTGKPDPSFGDGGSLDLRARLRRPATHREWGVSSPPLVCGDVVVVGSTILDRPLRRLSPPGDVQAFDVRTGRAAWTFHNPPRPGEPGYESWLDGSADEAGGANVWTTMSCDAEEGLVYLPFSTPTNDFYGGHRPGDGLFGESLVAVRATDGRHVWHLQTVRHGVWDYDLPTAPILADIEVAGGESGGTRRVAAVAQISKQGFVWVLDRRTGEPVWPIEERPVPPSEVPGETLSPTQPFPTKPAPFERQGIRAEDVIDWTPELRAEALAILAPYNYGALYTPPRTDRRTINLPGNNGGGNWPGGALDPETNVLYVPSYYGPTTTLLVEPDPTRSDLRFVPDIERFVAGPDGLHVVKPPYGRITAIDLDTGEHLWWAPHGRGPVDHPRLRHLALPPMGESQRGYPLVTRTLLFMAQGSTERGRLPTDAPDRPNFRAFDKATGEVVWATRLPGEIAANPMTYAAGGWQFVVVALSAPSRLIALALTDGVDGLARDGGTSSAGAASSRQATSSGGAIATVPTALPAGRPAGGETMQIEVDGATLHVEVDGPTGADAVLLWNGAGCTTRMWDLVVPRLAERYRVVRFDVRGTGQSTPADDPAQYTFEQYARDADAILDRLSIGRAHVWAMAWGSRAALAYAVLRPERVRKVALYDASIGAADTEAQARGHREAVEKQTAAGIAAFERPAGWNQHRHPDAVPRALAAARRFDLPAAADRLEAETLVATGDHDPNLASSRDLVARAKRARLVVLENVGHGSVLQRPDLVTDLVLEFLAER